jgi:hypothetical protein
MASADQRDEPGNLVAEPAIRGVRASAGLILRFPNRRTLSAFGNLFAIQNRVERLGLSL